MKKRTICENGVSDTKTLDQLNTIEMASPLDDGSSGAPNAKLRMVGFRVLGTPLYSLEMLWRPSMSLLPLRHRSTATESLDRLGSRLGDKILNHAGSNYDQRLAKFYRKESPKQKNTHPGDISQYENTYIFESDAKFQLVSVPRRNESFPQYPETPYALERALRTRGPHASCN
ncbi:hypothetical protein RF11_12078 [Thelohanellus kitauei]|uniref:Uncharacterized protein n=1 Tax=Thelohanellus kitauei TaxID=669202 RepID=A0A0C2MAD0_THEKT|nr:hypothetical protein RF11_12078 [Thelohanellus kitauei]